MKYNIEWSNTLIKNSLFNFSNLVFLPVHCYLHRCAIVLNILSCINHINLRLKVSCTIKQFFSSTNLILGLSSK